MKATVEIAGIDELKELLETAKRQAHELVLTASAIEAVRLNLQLKINRPPAATDD